MPRLSGRRSTRALYPLDSVQIGWFADTVTQYNLLEGKACCIKEHEGNRVFVRPYDYGKEGTDGVASSVVLVGCDDNYDSVGWACPTCTDVILGLGRG